MGRETKLLLGLLATLFGVFMGVLSMKLLVPRPPAGTGPDIRADVARAGPDELVEPPQPRLRRPPEPETVAPPPVASPPPGGSFADRQVSEPPAPSRDPFVAPASFEPPAHAGLRDAGPRVPLREPGPRPAAGPVGGPEPRVPDTGPTAGSAYVTRPGDSWWMLAERAYGDGRLYRAIFAWNRSLDRRVSLTPGTSLEFPPLPRLRAAWPALVPGP